MLETLYAQPPRDISCETMLTSADVVGRWSRLMMMSATVEPMSKIFFIDNYDLFLKWLSKYTMCIPPKMELRHMIQWFLPYDKVGKIMELLYHDDTFENPIERHDSMIPTLRQSR